MQDSDDRFGRLEQKISDLENRIIRALNFLGGVLLMAGGGWLTTAPGPREWLLPAALLPMAFGLLLVVLNFPLRKRLPPWP